METPKIRRRIAAAAVACVLALAACGTSAKVSSSTSPTPAASPSDTAPASPTATAASPAGPAASPGAARSAAPTPTPTTSPRPAVPTGVPSRPPTPSPAATTPPAAPGTLVLGDASNAKTVHAAAAQQISLSLGSTYWTFEALPDATVLRSDGAPVTTPSPGCVPGAGCGTVTEVFTAVGPGQVTIRADRRTCGEAMLCTGTAGQFAVTVVVP